MSKVIQYLNFRYLQGEMEKWQKKNPKKPCPSSVLWIFFFRCFQLGRCNIWYQKYLSKGSWCSRKFLIFILCFVLEMSHVSTPPMLVWSSSCWKNVRFAEKLSSVMFCIIPWASQVLFLLQPESSSIVEIPPVGVLRVTSQKWHWQIFLKFIF